MPSITIEIFDHIVFLVLVAFVPWNAGRRFRTLTKAVDAGDPNARKGAYRRILIEKWVWAAVIGVAWITLSRSAESIGLIAGITPLAIVGYALAALAIGALLMSAQSVARSERLRARTRKSIAPVRAMVPHTATEKRWFDRVSVTAGISEEFVYRGFLFAYLTALIPGMPVGVVVVLAGLVFGLGHSYQGLSGIVKTGTLGILFGAVYWMTASLLAAMLLHAAVDLASGWISWRVIRDGDPAEIVAPAAA
jgi:membrane protease YdiL (CAAX protease family)